MMTEAGSAAAPVWLGTRGLRGTTGPTIRAALLATLFIVAWNALFVFVMDESYRHEPARLGDLILSCAASYAIIAALPILILSPILIVLAGRLRARDSDARDGGGTIASAVPAGVAAGVLALLIAAGILGAPAESEGGGRVPVHALDLLLVAAAAIGAAFGVARLVAASRRSAERASRIRSVATLVAAAPCSLAAWEALRDLFGSGGSRVADVAVALAALAGGLALAWGIRGLLSAFSTLGQRLRRGTRARIALLVTALLLGPASLAALLRGSPSEAAGPAAGGRPNVLLLVADTLRADHVGCYGAARTKTPNIDALAARGARVESVTAAGAWTAPTTASVLTGLYPSRHGLLSYRDRIRDDVVSLAGFLRKAGYATAGFSANPILSPRYGFGSGFDVWEENLLEAGLRRHLRSPLGATLSWAGLLPPPERFVRAGELFGRALDWIDLPREKPFFLYLQVMDAHDPYDPPAPFDTMYGEGSSPGFRMKIGTLSDILDARIPAGRAELDRMIELYDGAISYMDDRIGRLMNELSGRGLLDDTLVVFTFDHGEEFLDHGDLEHTRTLYEEIVRGPLIFAGPGVRPGHLIRGTVPQVDIAPTVLEGAGLRLEHSLDGRSLWPSVSGAEEHEPREAFMSLLYFGFRSPWHAALSVRSGDLKLTGTRRSTREGEHWAWDLFDLSEDPSERRNLSSVRSDDLAALHQRLDNWGGRPGELGGPLPPLDEEVERRLRTLGYVD